MKLWAISDVHVGNPDNRASLEAIPPRPDDWLIIAGDVGETFVQLAWTLDVLGKKFRRLVWVPGNHELWSVPSEPPITGEARYLGLVELCRRFGVLTPEDPFDVFEGEGGPVRVAPLFLGYDYTFRPDDVTAERALDWAMESGVLCADEKYLACDPYPSKQAWCAARVASTAARLEQVDPAEKLVLVNHFPLRRSHAVLPLVPRFSIWCGTRSTDDWHRRFNVGVVVYGHLHIPQTRVEDGVRFEEVSLGMPRQWRSPDGAAAALRQVWPPPGSSGP